MNLIPRYVNTLTVDCFRCWHKWITVLHNNRSCVVAWRQTRGVRQSAWRHGGCPSCWECSNRQLRWTNAAVCYCQCGNHPCFWTIWCAKRVRGTRHKKFCVSGFCLSLKNCLHTRNFYWTFKNKCTFLFAFKVLLRKSIWV